jgi:hypothetical protein
VTRPAVDYTLTPDQIDRAFACRQLFSRTAYRLELLDWYTTPATEARLDRFLEGEAVTAAERERWLSMLRAGIADGQSISRVHVIAEPLTDYLKFELACYQTSAEAGEDIRILPAETAASLDLPDFDYWLFDDNRVAVMLYGDRGAWHGAEIISDPQFAAQCRSWRDTAMSHATPLHTYLAGRRTTP